MQINSAFPQGPMNLLDRLKQAEAAATVEHDSEIHRMASCPRCFAEREIRELLRNHAADLIRLVEAVNIRKNLEHALYIEGCAYDHLTERWRVLNGQLAEAHKTEDAALAPFLDEEDAR